jgi:acetyl-CoA carboxylase biotin carboxylase subunit
MVTGVDIVREQIQIAQGKKLSYKQSDIKMLGCAIECRINAENPDKNFMPSAGKIEGYIAPGGYGVRIDSHIYTGYTIPPNYDSMIGKLICYGKTREEARTRALRALEEYVILGVSTTIPFHKRILDSEEFKSADFDTSFIEKLLSE